MLSKKYHKIFAEIIARSETVNDIQYHLEDYFAMKNYRFNVVKFREAIKKYRELLKTQHYIDATTY